MNSIQSEVSRVLGQYTARVEAQLLGVFSQHPTVEMYRHMEYFAGFRDEQLQEAQVYGGKRYRSALCLLVASCYGHTDQALAAATSIELYHNFTLIHDDIQDRDLKRRGRPTVWALWGINQGINTGDAQLVLAQRVLSEAALQDSARYLPVLDFLLGCYQEVIEGQFLDFSLAEAAIDSPEVTIERYIEMIGKKTSILLGAATKSGALVAGASEEELEKWWQYGFHVGLAYQMVDDYASIWGSVHRTGKERYGDIKEQKKTLPILYALEELQGVDRRRLLDIYHQPGVDDAQVKEVVALVDQTAARERVSQEVERHKHQALQALEGVDIETGKKELVLLLNQVLLPPVDSR